MTTMMMTSRALRSNNLRSLLRQQGKQQQQQQIYTPICRSLHLSGQLLTTSQSLHHVVPTSSLLQSRTISVSTIQRQEEKQPEEQEEREKTSGEKDIEEILQKEFNPKHLQVQDVSGGCGSFYAIIIASSQFKGITTVKAHRLVNSALKDIIKDIHGLQLRTIPADE